MTDEEYLAQDLYFSESEGELISPSDMPFQHAYYAWRKSVSEFGDRFIESQLNQAFMERLSPSRDSITLQFHTMGKATHVWLGNYSREKLRRVAHQMGLKVTTHKDGAWVTATVVTDVVVRVKGEQHGTVSTESVSSSS
jgi:hypothetical protein